MIYFDSNDAAYLDRLAHNRDGYVVETDVQSQL